MKKDKLIIVKRVTDCDIIQIFSGGVPCGLVQHVITEEDLKEASITSLIVSRDTDVHCDEQTKIYIVWEGAGQIRFGKESQAIRKGDVVVIKPGLSYNITSKEHSGLNAWVVALPAWTGEDKIKF